MKKPRKSTFTPLRKGINVYFMLIVFGVLLCTVITLTIIGVICYKIGFLDIATTNNVVWSFVVFFASGLITGIVLYLIFSKVTLKPLNGLIDGINKLAEGKYETRLTVGKNVVLDDVRVSFNKLATELQNTELIQSDFINNFSHEFKTPIVSICGFAKLLNDQSLSAEKRTEYAEIIEKQARRLSAMATNVLNLTKLESQNILSEVTCFNLAEQIRLSVLLLENKWQEKNIEFNLNLDECNVTADQELLNQVWINLIDNAVKFSIDNGQIDVALKKLETDYIITIINQGVTIPQDELPRIFSKFYQADKSHKHQGNGIGLSIVKRIIDLHGGQITATSDDGITTFTVSLPNAQKN